MSRQIDLQNVAAVLYDYWPDEYNRVRSALEAIIRYEPCDDTADADVEFLIDGQSASEEAN